MSYSLKSLSGSNSSLPEPANANRRRKSRLEIPRLTKLWRYLNKLGKFNHMDFEFAAWQMIYLFTAPSKVYRNMYYRKQTKNQYGRDDPAFLVLLSVWCLIATSGLSLILGLSFFGFIKFLFWIVFVDCVACGLIVASLFWLFSNNCLRDKSDDEVEWAFSFDIHLNAFFPPLVIVHVFQLFFYSIVINHDWFVSRLFGNSLILVAISYYFYITFLGYSSLPYLQKTKTILYPLVPVLLIYLITLICGFNICQTLMNFYEYRIYY